MHQSLAEPVHRLANNPALRRIVLVLRYPLGLLGVILILPWLRPEYFFIGLGVSVFGEVIQMWAFASLSKLQDLAANGPYALVRNPMYIGRYFLIIGGVLMIGNAALVAIVTLLFYFHVLNRVRREEAMLADAFGESFAQYCATTNRFLPSLRGVKAGDLWYFRWRLLAQNHAYLNLLGALLAWGILYYFALVR